jgi:hypothetical protein
VSFGCYGTCAVSRDLAARDEHEVCEIVHAALVVDVSQELASQRHWSLVAEYIAENAMWAQLTDALRRASLGERDALGEIEALALAARDAVATRIVDRYLETNPRPPYAPGRLLAKYPTGRIPYAELLHTLQLDAAA